MTAAPVTVLYCGICTLPVEYCEFGKPFRKCKTWLEENHHDVFVNMYESDKAGSSSLSREKEAKMANSLAKMQLKEERKQEREMNNLKNIKILIKRIPRTKHKNIIAIANLELVDIDMKKLAKLFASKFATGSSVSKNVEKKDEIVIQGDVGDEVEEYLLKMLKDKGLTDVKVEIIEERKPKKKAPVP